MKQFGKILKFELKGYLKNKIFVGSTILLVVVLAIVMFIPNIKAAFQTDGKKEKPIMIVYAEDETLSGLVKEYFSDAFPAYNVTVSDGTIDDIKSRIVSGDAECAFVMNNASSYTYYVNNLSMSDYNTSVADAALREAYKANAMIRHGLTPEQVGEIMSVQIVSETNTL